MHAENQPANARPISLRAAAELLLLGIIVRATVMFALHDQLFEDPDAYRQLAGNLLEHGTLGFGTRPSAFRPPLYPLLLVPCEALGRWAPAAIAYVHLMLGAVTMALVLATGLRLQLGRAAAVAMLLVAFDPILLNQQSLVMTETLATALAALGFWTLVRLTDRPTLAAAAVAGACLGVAMLCRPTFSGWLIFVIVAAPWRLRRTRGRWTISAALAAAALLALAPWIVRNAISIGRPLAMTTHGGYTLLLANNPLYYEHLRGRSSRSPWDAAEFNRRWRSGRSFDTPADELANDRTSYEEARANIQRWPRMFAYACVARLRSFWAVTPERIRDDELVARRWIRLSIGVWYTIELVLAAMGLWIVWRRGDIIRWMPGLQLLVALSVAHTVYWSDMRMRGPLMPVVALLAAAALARIYARWQHRNTAI